MGQGAGTLTLRHAIPPPRASKLSFWMENIILHFVYCVPKLHIHHAATQEGWTSVSATSATVFRTWVWQILSPQAGSWWGLGLSPILRFVAARLALLNNDEALLGVSRPGLQPSTSRALSWINNLLPQELYHG